MYNTNGTRRTYTKTKQQICRTFFDLLEKDPYEKIKVKNIVDVLGITRQTFYQYYENKEDLLNQIIGDLAEGLISPIKESGEKGLDYIVDCLTEPYHPDFLRCFQYMRCHRGEFLSLLRTDAETGFTQRFQKEIDAFRESRIQCFSGISANVCADYIRQMYSNIMNDFIAGLFLWIQIGQEEGEVAMATLYTQMWVGGILLSKNKKESVIYKTLIKKIEEKHLSGLDWMDYYTSF